MKIVIVIFMTKVKMENLTSRVSLYLIVKLQVKISLYLRVMNRLTKIGMNGNQQHQVGKSFKETIDAIETRVRRLSQ